MTEWNYFHESVRRCVVVERKDVRDNVRATQVSLESSGEFRHLPSHDDRVRRLDAVSVLQLVVPRHVRHAGREHRVGRRRGEGHLPRRLQRHLAAQRRQRRVQHSRGTSERLRLRQQCRVTGQADPSSVSVPAVRQTRVPYGPYTR